MMLLFKLAMCLLIVVIIFQEILTELFNNNINIY